MTLGEHVYLYCERGTNGALWAEPINAISNAGFFLAALIFWQLVLWRPKEQRSPDHYLFVALVFAICAGSVAFHVYADRVTELADVIPIGLFMLVYLGFALNRFLNVPPGWTVFLAAIFAGLVAGSMQIHCWEGGIGFAGGAPDEKVCLNGSVGYLPALAALIVVGMLLAERRHKAAPYVLAATVIFTGSILLRSLDMSFCQRVVIEGRPVGTHFIWHLLNALVLFLLMRASLETGTRPVPATEAAAPPAGEQTPSAESEAEADKPKSETKAGQPANESDETAPEETKDDSAKAENAEPAEEEAKPEPEPQAMPESGTKPEACTIDNDKDKSEAAEKSMANASPDIEEENAETGNDPADREPGGQGAGNGTAKKKTAI